MTRGLPHHYSHDYPLQSKLYAEAIRAFVALCLPGATYMNAATLTAIGAWAGPAVSLLVGAFVYGKLTEKVARHDVQIEKVEVKSDGTDTRVTKLEVKVDDCDKRISRLEASR